MKYEAKRSGSCITDTLCSEIGEESSWYHSSDSKLRQDVHLDAIVGRASRLLTRCSSGNQRLEQLQSLDDMVTTVLVAGRL